MRQWRFTLDQPYSFAIENGTNQAKHCADFRPQPDSFSNTYIEPTTGVLMLKPSSEVPNYYANMLGLAQWRLNSDFWKESKRSTDLTSMMTNIAPTGGDPTLIEILVECAIVAIEADIAARDDMKWVAESNVTLDVDEGFAIFYHAITDEIVRKNNWFYLQWGNIGLHFSQQGLIRVYKYDPSDVTSDPVKVHEFQIAGPGELTGKFGYFRFIPIPGLGLLVQHSSTAQAMNTLLSNARGVTSRGHLIPWDSHDDGNGHLRLFESSPLRLAINPYLKKELGFAQIRYPASGTYTDAALDPGYAPSHLPDQVDPLPFHTAQEGNVSATLKKTDLSGDWVPLTDRLGRVQLSLTTDNSKYTPFVGGYALAWSPVFATRNTTPLTLARRSGAGVVDKILRLEWTDDENGSFEGHAKMLLQSDLGQHIAERGDATFLLEVSEDDGSTWATVEFGLAKDWKLDAIIDMDWPFCYEATCTLYSLRERLKETHLLSKWAFDGVTPGEGINKELTAAGFAPIDPLPAETTAFTLPTQRDGQQWRFAPREGEDGEEVLDHLLLFLRGQNSEWRAIFDAPDGVWFLEQKPMDTSDTGTWTLSPYSNDRDAGNRVWTYQSLKLEPEPPEGNVVLVEGLTTPDAAGTRIPADPLINDDSINNVDSDDYLGRMVVVKVNVHGATDKPTVNLFALRVFDAIKNRRLKGSIVCPHFQAALYPCRLLKVYKDGSRYLPPLWIKRRTVVIEREDQEMMTLSVDSVWTGEVK